MIRVYGEPAPQGSKRAYVRGKRAILVESSAKVKPWRQAIVGAVMRQQPSAILRGPVCVRITFIHKRPQSHFGMKQGKPYLKPMAPRWVTKTPDLDKLLRSTFDGLVDGGLLEDDSQVVIVHAQQRFSDPGEREGALIHAEAVDTSEGPRRAS